MSIASRSKSGVRDADLLMLMQLLTCQLKMRHRFLLEEVYEMGVKKGPNLPTAVDKDLNFNNGLDFY